MLTRHLLTKFGLSFAPKSGGRLFGAQLEFRVLTGCCLLGTNSWECVHQYGKLRRLNSLLLSATVHTLHVRIYRGFTVLFLPAGEKKNKKREVSSPLLTSRALPFSRRAEKKVLEEEENFLFYSLTTYVRWASGSKSASFILVYFYGKCKCLARFSDKILFMENA